MQRCGVWLYGITTDGTHPGGGGGRPPMGGEPGMGMPPSGEAPKKIDPEKMEKKKIAQEEKLRKSMKKILKSTPLYDKWLSLREAQLTQKPPREPRERHNQRPENKQAD